MKRAKYEVWKQSNLTAIYVTEKKNAEVMIREIIKLHESIDDTGKQRYFKIVQVIDGERNIIYTPRMRNFWLENLEV